jgi:Domain of unknown function (DUF4136)
MSWPHRGNLHQHRRHGDTPERKASSTFYSTKTAITPAPVEKLLTSRRTSALAGGLHSTEKVPWRKTMKMNMKRTFVPAGIALLFTASAVAQQVKTDFDHNANFNQYKTFSFEKIQTPDPFWVDRIKSSVSASLTAKGWTQVASGGDATIVAMEIDQTHRSLNTYYDGFGGGWGWRWGGGLGETTTTVDTYEVGTLVVDLFDARTKKLLWRGSSSETLSDKADKNAKALDKGVQKMFDHFPPEKK